VSTFEDLSVARCGFDLILAQESSQYIDKRVLFTKARQLLAKGGALLIVDQVALRRVPAQESPLHLDAEFKAQARRAGFTLVEHIDLARKAMPTLDYILETIGHHRERLQEIMHLDASTLDALVAAVAANRLRYHQGTLGYALYRFRA
jgi:hypothetical protein